MELIKNNLIVKRAMEYEINLCIQANRLCNIMLLRRLFVISSVTGNGPFWYVLILVLPIIFGLEKTSVSLRMTAAGLVGLLIYKAIKHYTVRPRPYTRTRQIRPGTPPLDKYSFPSGHTLHATSFTIITCYFLPGFTWILIPLTGLIALSRVVLGLHYPTDVAAGFIIGTSVAIVCISI